MRGSLIAAVSIGLFCGVAAHAADQKPAAPKPAPKKEAPKLTELPAPTSVRMTHVQPIVAAPLAELAAEPLPAYIAEAVVLTRPYGKYEKSEAAGRLNLDVLADGPVLLAVSTRYDGFVLHEMWHENHFRDGGWMPIRPISLIDTAGGKPAPYLLQIRDCKAGEKISLRAHVNFPPLVILPEAGADVPNAATFEPDPKLPERLQRDVIRAKGAVLLDCERLDELEALADGYIRNDTHFPCGRAKFAELHHPYSFPQTNETEAKFVRRVELMETWLKRKPESVAARICLARCALRFSEYLRFARGVKDGAARSEEIERRALEVLYDAEQTGSKSPQLYNALMALAAKQGWDEELAMRYVEEILPEGRWCPEIVMTTMQHIFGKYGGSSPEQKAVLKQKLEHLFALTKQHLGPKFGDAALAAALAEYYYVHPEDPFRRGTFEWPRIRTAFEDWDRSFPNSQRIGELFARFASSVGDRETAHRMFERLGDFNPDNEEVWTYGPDMRADRAWAADDYLIGDQRRVLENPGQTVGAVAWIDDGRRLLWADHGGKLYRCDAAEGTREYLREGTFQRSICMAVSSDGDLALIGAMAEVFALVRLSDQSRTLLNVGRSDVKHVDVERVAFSADDRRALAGFEDGFAAYYDLTDEKKSKFRELNINEGKRFQAVGFSADGQRLYFVGGNGKFVVCETDTGNVLSSTTILPRGCSAAAFSADRKQFATVGGGNRLLLWNAADGAKLWDVAMTGPQPTRIALSPDGTVIAVGTGAGDRVDPQEVRFYTAADGRLLKTCAGHKAGITSLAFSPDGKTLASSSLDRSVRLWDVPQN